MSFIFRRKMFIHDTAFTNIILMLIFLWKLAINPSFDILYGLKHKRHVNSVITSRLKHRIISDFVKSMFWGRKCHFLRILVDNIDVKSIYGQLHST